MIVLRIVTIAEAIRLLVALGFA